MLRLVMRSRRFPERPPRDAPRREFMPDIPSLMSQADAFRAAGRLEEAEARYRQVLAAQPRHGAAWNGLAQMAIATRQFELGASLLAQAIACAPTDPGHYVDLGICLGELNRWEMAIQAHRQALKLAPDHFPALTHLGRAFCNLNRTNEAIAHVRQAIRIRPSLDQAHWCLALALLVSGQWAEGWEEYEWRLRMDPKLDPKLDVPKWRGEAAPNATILLCCEQGAGDTVQFLRYAPLVKARVGRVVLSCQDNLVTLARTAEGLDEVVPKSKSLPRCDRYAMLLSLPQIFGTTPETVPARVPYLRAPEVSADEQVVRTDPTVLRIGLVWAGNPKHGNDANRSVPFPKLAPLLATPGARFFSLQVGARAADWAQEAENDPLSDWSGRLQDYADTAAAMMRLDLVITVDTSVAHVAGALGRPVWTLHPFAPDWRWLLHGSKSAWYPTMRLFRQPQPGDWETVVAEVAKALHEWIAVGARKPGIVMA
jgi:tetratricopeptide (TPR) repeat protein